jgi:hypothetical protein
MVCLLLYWGFLQHIFSITVDNLLTDSLSNADKESKATFVFSFTV